MNNSNPQSQQSWNLKQADQPLRLFITAFLALMTIGYTIGLVFVDHTTQGTHQGLVEEYRGTPEQNNETELKYAKSADEMYIFLHNHVLSLSLVFASIGLLFYFSSVQNVFFKKLLLVEPFIAVATTFGGIWLMRFVSEYFSWLVIVSGTSMVICYIFMVTIILKDLWIRR